ncbi:MAG TPA: efflux RND transporter permease subunit [Gemmataceae bacterium]|nr:efflux RND transporter permease subunit [Gemmataceae bacterium]
MKTIRRVLLIAIPLIVIGLLASCTYFGVVYVQELTSENPPLPAITVEAEYPGAAAQVVADTVAGPIEAQVNGVERMVSMHSRCTSDGRYQLTVNFQRDTDLNMAQVLVQNRVSLALPIMPNLVQNQGVSVKKTPPGILLIVNVTSPDGSRDAVFLSNHALLQVKDELTRVTGVGDVVLLGKAESRTRIEFDNVQLTANGITIQDALDMIRQQKVAVAGGLHGNRRLMPAKIREVEVFGNIVLKATADGEITRLNDVAKITNGVTHHTSAQLNGRPTASLLVYLLPETNARESAIEVESMVKRLSERLPKGVSLDIDFEFTSNLHTRPRFDYLWLDVDLPAGAARERTIEQMHAIQQNLRTLTPVADVLALSGPPITAEEEHGCMLIRLDEGNRSAAERADIMQALRTRIDKDVPGAVIRLRDLTGTRRLPPGDYPIRLGVAGPTLPEVRAFAAALADGMRADPGFIDVHTRAAAGPANRPGMEIEILQEAIAMHGIPHADLMGTISVYMEASPGPEFANVELRLQRDQDLQKVMIRSGGKLIPLEKLVKVRPAPAMAVMHRFNSQPAEFITANPAPNVSLAAARVTCETLGDQVRQQLNLSKEYRVIWP